MRLFNVALSLRTVQMLFGTLRKDKSAYADCNSITKIGGHRPHFRVTGT